MGALKHGSADVHFERGNQLSDQGETDQARREWGLAIQQDPNHLDAHYALAQSYEKEENWELVESEYREMLRIDPDAVAAHYGLARIFDERSDFGNAVREYREALRISPDDDEVRRDLVWALMEQGDRSNAQVELENIKDFERDDGQLWSELGDAFAARGESAQSINAFKEALEIDPDLHETRVKLKRLAPIELEDVPPSTRRYVLTRLGIPLAALTWIVLMIYLVTAIVPALPTLGKISGLFLEERLVLEADHPVSDIELSASATNLSERFRSIDASVHSIRTSAPNRVIVRLQGDTHPPSAVWENGPGNESLEFVDTGNTRIPDGTIIETSGANSVVDAGTPAPTVSSTNSAGNKTYRTVMTGRQIRSAAVACAPTTNKPYIAFSMTGEGTQIFADHTAKNVGKYLSIALDHRVISSPVIKSAITQGGGIIEGEFTLPEAQALVIQLTARSLPVNFHLVSDETVIPFTGD